MRLRPAVTTFLNIFFKLDPPAKLDEYFQKKAIWEDVMG
jgi:hypothetical protein